MRWCNSTHAPQEDGGDDEDDDEDDEDEEEDVEEDEDDALARATAAEVNARFAAVHQRLAERRAAAEAGAGLGEGGEDDEDDDEDDEDDGARGLARAGQQRGARRLASGRRVVRERCRSRAPRRSSACQCMQGAAWGPNLSWLELRCPDADMWARALCRGGGRRGRGRGRARTGGAGAARPACSTACVHWKRAPRGRPPACCARQGPMLQARSLKQAALQAQHARAAGQPCAAQRQGCSMRAGKHLAALVCAGCI